MEWLCRCRVRQSCGTVCDDHTLDMLRKVVFRPVSSMACGRSGRCWTQRGKHRQRGRKDDRRPANHGCMWVSEDYLDY